MRTPVPEIIKRPMNRAVYDAALSEGLSKFQARIVANRGLELGNGSLQPVLTPDIASLDSPETLPDFKKGVERIAKAVLDGERIAIETDHDVDGVTSHATIYASLIAMGVPPEKVSSHIGHRLKEGYGLSAPVAQRIIDEGPDLVITADNGSSDEPRIKMLADAGIDTVVTDHHGLPEEGPPVSAHACISPAREDSDYPDPLIAGVTVSWLLMCGVRIALVGAGHKKAKAFRPEHLLDFVALGTVADCVSMSRSHNNRAFVLYGLGVMNRNARPCWEALRPRLRAEKRAFVAEDLGFGIGPRINARGRLDEAMAGVRFLLSEDPAEAMDWADILEQENEARKTIERGLKEEAFSIAARQRAEGRTGIACWLPEGHPGVHGIVASRVVEAFGHPVICISPHAKDERMVTGSARGVPGMNVRDAFQHINDHNPGLLDKFGGHEGAGGLGFKREKLAQFIEAWDEAVAAQNPSVGPIRWVDGAIKPEAISLKLVQDMAVLGPYGKEFEPPAFAGKFTVRTAKAIGDGTHIKWGLSGNGKLINAVQFGAIQPGDDLPAQPGQEVKAVFTINANEFRGETTVQLLIQHIRSIEA